MAVLESIANRHSYRGKYLPKPVPREALRDILQAGLDAPSGCNKQTTSLICVDDPVLVRQLGDLLHNPPYAATAPAAILVLSKPIIGYYVEGKPVILNVQDYSAAIENILVQMVSFGLASTWIEGQVTDERQIGKQMAELLGVPEQYTLVAYLGVGYPEKAPQGPAKKPFEKRAWFNGFGKEEA